MTSTSLAESFYYVKYGSSIITSKIPSKILSNKNKKTGVSRKRNTSVYVFITEILWLTFDVIIDDHI